MSNNTREPMVSVILPAYNASGYIGEAVRGVLSQTYTNFELIIIDDGSTDNTADIVKSVDDERIRYIRTENQGNYFARNRGLKESKGRYIAFLDSDDIWLEDKLKTQISIFLKDNDIGLCCTDYYVFFDEDKKNVYKDTQHTFSEELMRQKRFIEILLLKNIIITSSVMVKNACFKHLGGFDTAHQNAMDYEMWLRIAMDYKIYYAKERTLLKRLHRWNISKNRIKEQKALLYIFNDKLASYIKDTRFFDERHKKLLKKKIQGTLYALGLEYLGKTEYRDALQYLKMSEYRERNLFRHIAMAVAKFHLGVLVPLIRLYRSQREKHTLIRTELNG